MKNKYTKPQSKRDRYSLEKLFFIYFVRRFSTKQIKRRYLHEINANPYGNELDILIIKIMGMSHSLKGTITFLYKKHRY